VEDLLYSETYFNPNFLQYEIEERSLKFGRTIKIISPYFLTISTLPANRIDI